MVFKHKQHQTRMLTLDSQHLVSQNPCKGYQFSEVSSHLGAKKIQTSDVHLQNDRCQQAL